MVRKALPKCPTNAFWASGEPKRRKHNSWSILFRLFLYPKQFKGPTARPSSLAPAARFLHSKCSSSKLWGSFWGLCCYQPQRWTLPGKKGDSREKGDCRATLAGHTPALCYQTSLRDRTLAFPLPEFQRLCWNHLGNNAWGSLAKNKQILWAQPGHGRTNGTGKSRNKTLQWNCVDTAYQSLNSTFIAACSRNKVVTSPMILSKNRDEDISIL